MTNNLVWKKSLRLQSIYHWENGWGVVTCVVYWAEILPPVFGAHTFDISVC